MACLHRKSTSYCIKEDARVVSICAKMRNGTCRASGRRSRIILKRALECTSRFRCSCSEAYDLLGLQTYFTAGKQEVRAWTVRKGAKAPEAAGVIHTVLKKGLFAPK